MIVLIAPPLPAASRPSKTHDDLQARVADPLLEPDELDLEPSELRLVELRAGNEAPFVS